MAYKVHPTSTVSTSFSVSGAASVDLAINEDVDSADDGAKYAYANSAGDDFEVLLEEPPFTPSIGSGHVVRFRAKGGGTGAAAQLIVYLIDRSMVPEVTLYEGEKITLSSSFSTYEVDLGLTEPLADYSSLSLLVTDSGPAGEMRVNLSARQFASAELDEQVRAVLRDTQVPPALLELELTESMLMREPAQAVATLEHFRSYGLRLSVDDFGTGYSSLSYLRRFPLDALKVDRAFVRDLATNADDMAITLAIISMAHSLKLKVVAEGVETAEQLDLLASAGCDEIQGFYFSQPVSAHEMERMLREGLAMHRQTGSDVPTQGHWRFSAASMP